MSDDPRIGFLKADVARFCAGLDELAPAIRLRLVVRLREALGEVTEAALACLSTLWLISLRGGCRVRDDRCRVASGVCGRGG